jgi:hypothetical protein
MLWAVLLARGLTTHDQRAPTTSLARSAVLPPPAVGEAKSLQDLKRRGVNRNAE